LCAAGHGYAVYAGVPVLLLDDEPHTHPVASRSLDIASGRLSLAVRGDANSNALDPVVRELLPATCGRLYMNAVGRRRGRWCISAARKGYSVMGIDPSLEGVFAARRVAKQLHVDADFIVADARHLPFADASFDVVFSYSVLQHFAKDDVRVALREARRVLRPGGVALIQLANRFGLRSIVNRRRAREPEEFDVRYWTPGELIATFEELIGPAELRIDGFFSLNAQRSDIHLLPYLARPVVYASEALRFVARLVRPLTYVADSLYVYACRARDAAA
jgi:SAM-dependent methyltransferase